MVLETCASEAADPHTLNRPIVLQPQKSAHFAPRNVWPDTFTHRVIALNSGSKLGAHPQQTDALWQIIGIC